MEVKRSGVILKADCERVLLRPFSVSDDNRARRIIARIFELPEQEVNRQLQQITTEFADRHSNLLEFYQKRFEEMRFFLPSGISCSEARSLLTGAYFSNEYSVESAALFNPSIVWAPDQSGIMKKKRRFILSLRATGEGHISSITFRTGVIDEHQKIILEKPDRIISSAEMQTDPAVFNKNDFIKKMEMSGLTSGTGLGVIGKLAEIFTLTDLQHMIKSSLPASPPEKEKFESITSALISLALSSYQLTFKQTSRISERIIFPVTPEESNGIEDARFVQFKDGTKSTYYATYTAYNGKVTRPKMLETKDFITFNFRALSGPAIKNKGLALFPRKINGKYAMLSREDHENNYIIFSDDLWHWEQSMVIERPRYPWEFIQLGNCGSPIETKAGWLVLSHGVGPMRKYSIGAFLLDLHDPTLLLGRTAQPIISPDATEREGYVPNVVYSCGGILSGDQLILPYAMSDSASAFATVKLDELLQGMINQKSV
jgi:predicted GH43/DUF377 family glycosyl hydrolase